MVHSLQAAEYCGSRVNLIVLFDAKASAAAVELARSIDWPHGARRVVTESESHGIRGMWTQVLGRELEHESDPTHVVPIEDDIEVSPLFHWWLRMAAKAYGPFDSARGSRMSSKLVGVSLYSPRLDEIHYPMTSWRPRDGKLRLVRWQGASPSSPYDGVVGDAPAFLFGLPCSWGALFFRSHWRRFIRFYATRASQPFYNFTHEDVQGGVKKTREVLGDPVLAIPESRSSTWPRSWKKFMIDYMYGRGDVMLYPSAPTDPQVPRTALTPRPSPIR